MFRMLFRQDNLSLVQTNRIVIEFDGIDIDDLSAVEYTYLEKVFAPETSIGMRLSNLATVVLLYNERKAKETNEKESICTTTDFH